MQVSSNLKQNLMQISGKCLANFRQIQGKSQTNLMLISGKSAANFCFLIPTLLDFHILVRKFLPFAIVLSLTIFLIERNGLTEGILEYQQI